MNFEHQFRQVRPAYRIPDQDLIGEVIVPAMRLADEVRIEAGFFSSRCLAQIAPGLAAFINDTSCTLRLMISPEISAEDQEAIRTGVVGPKTVLERTIAKLFESARISQSAIERHAVETLSYLVASNRLKIRVVLMNRGMFHKKIWLFRSGGQWLAVHGSGNATERGLLLNGEQMSVDRAWTDGSQSEARVNIFLDEWSTQWDNRYESSLTLQLDQVLPLLRTYSSSRPPTTSDFWKAWRIDSEAGLEPALPDGYESEPLDLQLQIPDFLEWTTGRYAHQADAVAALIDNGGGILSMATGGGKTRTALIAASQLQDTLARHLCVVILAPSRPLIRQWSDDVKDFGIDPVILTGMSPVARRGELERLAIAFRTIKPRTEILLMSNALFTQPDSAERLWLDRLPNSVTRLLIADEVHNLGSAAFVENPPEFFEHRVGLSATPIRQYDPDGTDQLFGYFGGPPVFEFTLGDAIASGCLVPYHYYLHPVEFDSAEMEFYEELTEELLRAGFRITDDGRTVGLTPRVEMLLRRRRALVEQAGAKLDALRTILTGLKPSSISKTLIYTSAKEVVMNKQRQITAVNRMLQDLRVTSHQYTSEETGSSRSTSLLEGFGNGDYQVLTAMRVLDEGIDIPQTDTAFLMASSTVEREWIQRRGRILRNAPGKKFAHLHDFIVVPPDNGSNSGASLLRSELRRANAFADLAENEYDPGGPNGVIREFESFARMV